MFSSASLVFLDNDTLSDDDATDDVKDVLLGIVLPAVAGGVVLLLIVFLLHIWCRGLSKSEQSEETDLITADDIIVVMDGKVIEVELPATVLVAFNEVQNTGKPLIEATPKYSSFAN